jgi:hypothetical protein
MEEIRQNRKWLRILFIIGIIALLAGTLDPLEGSVIILAGSILIAAATFLRRDLHWKIYMTAAAMIVFGVTALFYISALGGFGGNSGLSWWIGVFILPYPLGWFLIIITLILRLVKRKSQTV